MYDSVNIRYGQPTAQIQSICQYHNLPDLFLKFTLKTYPTIDIPLACQSKLTTCTAIFFVADWNILNNVQLDRRGRHEGLNNNQWPLSSVKSIKIVCINKERLFQPSRSLSMFDAHDRSMTSLKIYQLLPLVSVNTQRSSQLDRKLTNNKLLPSSQKKM